MLKMISNSKRHGFTPLEMRKNLSKSRDKSLTGFTFIELLISISIFSVIAVALYPTLNTGLQAWRRGQRSCDLYQVARIALDDIAGELRPAKVIHFSELGFVGQKDNLSFPVVVNVSSPGESKNFEIGKTSFYLDEEVLLKKKQTFIQSISDDQLESEELAANVKQLGFLYSYKSESDLSAYSWKDSWGIADSLPQAVKITLILADARQPDKEISFHKTVFIPTGILAEEE